MLTIRTAVYELLSQRGSPLTLNQIARVPEALSALAEAATDRKVEGYSLVALTGQRIYRVILASKDGKSFNEFVTAWIISTDKYGNDLGLNPIIVRPENVPTMIRDLVSDDQKYYRRSKLWSLGVNYGALWMFPGIALAIYFSFKIGGDGMNESMRVLMSIPFALASAVAIIIAAIISARTHIAFTWRKDQIAKLFYAAAA